jgi:hypothetical protein
MGAIDCVRARRICVSATRTKLEYLNDAALQMRPGRVPSVGPTPTQRGGPQVRPAHERVKMTIH